MVMMRKYTCMCGNVTNLSFTAGQLSKLQGGESVQKVFPEASPFFREVIISGMCYDCQERLFNRPAPGREKTWGNQLGCCPSCDRPIWEKDMKQDTYVCSQCGDVVTRTELEIS